MRQDQGSSNAEVVLFRQAARACSSSWRGRGPAPVAMRHGGRASCGAAEHGPEPRRRSWPHVASRHARRSASAAGKRAPVSGFGDHGLSRQFCLWWIHQPSSSNGRPGRHRGGPPCMPGPSSCSVGCSENWMVEKPHGRGVIRNEVGTGQRLWVNSGHRLPPQPGRMSPCAGAIGESIHVGFSPASPWMA